MKKIFLTFLAIFTAILLCGCSASVEEEGSAMAADLPISTLLEATAKGDSDTVRSLMHPGVAYSVFTEMYDELLQSLKGQEISHIWERSHYYERLDAAENMGSFSAKYTVKLENDKILVNVTYLKDSEGVGFVNFHCES